MLVHNFKANYNANNQSLYAYSIEAHPALSTYSHCLVTVMGSDMFIVLNPIITKNINLKKTNPDIAACGPTITSETVCANCKDHAMGTCNRES